MGAGFLPNKIVYYVVYMYRILVRMNKVVYFREYEIQYLDTEVFISASGPPKKISNRLWKKKYLFFCWLLLMTSIEMDYMY